MTSAYASMDCGLCYGDGPTCPVCPLNDTLTGNQDTSDQGLCQDPGPILTTTQCAALGISAADAADAAEWARAYGQLTEEQRDELRDVLNPFANRG